MQTLIITESKQSNLYYFLLLTYGNESIDLKSNFWIWVFTVFKYILMSFKSKIHIYSGWSVSMSVVCVSINDGIKNETTGEWPNLVIWIIILRWCYLKPFCTYENHRLRTWPSKRIEIVQYILWRDISFCKIINFSSVYFPSIGVSLLLKVNKRFELFSLTVAWKLEAE